MYDQTRPYRSTHFRTVRADASGLRDGLRRPPALDLQYNLLSTARRQPGILMHVPLEQPQLPRSEPDGQAIESAQLAESQSYYERARHPTQAILG